MCLGVAYTAVAPQFLRESLPFLADVAGAIPLDLPISKARGMLWFTRERLADFYLRAACSSLALSDSAARVQIAPLPLQILSARL